MPIKYIFITGGVCSSLGKGISAASIGMLLEKRGLKVAMLKVDPYLNIDPGTMSPYQHGEVYVTDDGAETDLDLGHYYRFTNSILSSASNMTSGQVYNTIIKRERRGEYLGKTVQVIPHITDEIKQRFINCSKQAPDIDVVVVEIGGTVGDIESLPFLEAIRQFIYERNGHCTSIHLTYVPYLKAAGEVKTKPSQHSVQALRAIGIIPDFIICRCEETLADDVKEKLSLFCHVPHNAVIEEIDVESIYEVPIKLHEQNLDAMICQKLNLQCQSEVDLSALKEIIQKGKNPKGNVIIGIIGKYTQHQDAYKSINEALKHSATSLGYSLEVRWFESDKIIKNGEVKDAIGGCDGYLVPGGFGERGWLGKILTAKFAREENIPYFGICLGMQVMAVEFARFAGIKEANSTEIDPDTQNPVIALLSEQHQIQDLGGTMRLGAYQCQLIEGSKAYNAYKAQSITERHRHRYEFNNKYKEALEKAGLLFSGMILDGALCEIIEVKNHPWMVGVQFHPEFKSKPTQPHPLFQAFVEASIRQKNKIYDRK